MATASAWASGRAHPRSRGAATRRLDIIGSGQGPSPLTRGSPRSRICRESCTGPIPAHAGQPDTGANRTRQKGAHPRSRGAAAPEERLSALAAGPSPLTRGSLRRLHRGLDTLGPIPAHAGQPVVFAVAVGVIGAHPRSRGAAASAVSNHPRAKGPSPLTRGSRQRCHNRDRDRGPIPAHAGQPLVNSSTFPSTRAHPRSRGAALCRDCTRSQPSGPSPLTRGSPLKVTAVPASTGPIPAHAGQPDGGA